MSKSWIRWAELIVVLVAGFLIANTIDRYISFDMPFGILAVNAVLPLAVLLLVWGLSGQSWIGLLVEALVVWLLRYADHTKVTFLNTDLVYADFTVLGGLLKDPKLILGFLHPGWALLAGAVAGVVVIVLLVWLARRVRPLAWPYRMVCVAIAVAVVVVASVYQAPAVIHPLNWEVYQQARGARRVGVAGNLLLGAMASADIKHDSDPSMQAAFWKEPLVQQFKHRIESDDATRHPDIVVVQSESLFRPSQLCGFSDTPVLRHITARDAGNLHVPVFGGRTLQTEFEVQSGVPIAFYPGSMFAYYELLHGRMDAWPHVMDKLGYHTLVIHPNARGFWNRDAAMPQLGFATFQDGGSFLAGDRANHGHVSDLAVSRAILAELDAANRPTYITAITMDNHGPWGDHAPDDDSGLGLPDALHGEARKQMADYISRTVDADAAFGYLIDALQRRGRPTIVALYGDHLPALAPVYQQLCFKDGKPPQAHMPPYRVWANFPIDTPPPDLPAYLLQGYIMRQAGLPLSGHVLANAIAGMVYADTSVAEADRKRILDEYANIAAANLEHKADSPDPDQGTMFVGRKNALETLVQLGKPKATAGRMETGRDDLYLLPDANGTASVQFGLGRQVASLTLRPYMLCSAQEGAVEPIVSLHADGHLLYSAPLGPDLVRLATLDLRDAQQLTIDVTHLHGDACGVYVRVAQLLRCADTCVNDAAEGAKAAPARIVGNDPTAGDRRAVEAMLSPEQKREANRKSNLHWLLGHELSRHKGFAPITLQGDGQLFMHPGDGNDSTITFDVSGLDAIELTPHINSLDAHCRSLGPKAGVVGLNVFVDDKPVIDKLTIDRDYDKPLHVDLHNASTLKLDVDNGNGVSWCDWFSIGASDMTLRGASPEAAAPH